MIIIRVKNGLGNQLFEYAFGLYIKSKYPNALVKYDFSELPYYIGNRYTVKISEIVNEMEELSAAEVRKYLGKFWYFQRPTSNHAIETRIWRKLTRNWSRVGNCCVIKEPDEYWSIEAQFLEYIDKIELKPDEDYLFDGFWENVKYVDTVKTSIIGGLNFKVSDKVQEIAKSILNIGETVSVHVRRGDYVKESEQIKYPKNFYTLCDSQYYERAFQIMNNTGDMTFVFFSDDPEFVRREFSNIKNKIVVEGNRDTEDLYLMTLCKHHIIANSTFSFWGAYLCENNGTTIAPQNHYIRMNSNTEHIVHPFFFVKDWIYIKV